MAESLPTASPEENTKSKIPSTRNFMTQIYRDLEILVEKQDEIGAFVYQSVDQKWQNIIINIAELHNLKYKITVEMFNSMIIYVPTNYIQRDIDASRYGFWLMKDMDPETVKKTDIGFDCYITNHNEVVRLRRPLIVRIKDIRNGKDSSRKEDEASSSFEENTPRCSRLAATLARIQRMQEHAKTEKTPNTTETDLGQCSKMQDYAENIPTHTKTTTQTPTQRLHKYPTQTPTQRLHKYNVPPTKRNVLDKNAASKYAPVCSTRSNLNVERKSQSYKGYMRKDIPETTTWRPQDKPTWTSRRKPYVPRNPASRFARVNRNTGSATAPSTASNTAPSSMKTVLHQDSVPESSDSCSDTTQIRPQISQGYKNYIKKYITHGRQTSIPQDRPPRDSTRLSTRHLSPGLDEKPMTMRKPSQYNEAISTRLKVTLEKEKRYVSEASTTDHDSKVTSPESVSNPDTPSTSKSGVELNKSDRKNTSLTVLISQLTKNIEHIDINSDSQEE